MDAEKRKRPLLFGSGTISANAGLGTSHAVMIAPCSTSTATNNMSRSERGWNVCERTKAISLPCRTWTPVDILAFTCTARVTVPPRRWTTRSTPSSSTSGVETFSSLPCQDSRFTS